MVVDGFRWFQIVPCFSNYGFPYEMDSAVQRHKSASK